MDLTEALRDLLMAKGAGLVGIGSMEGVPDCEYCCGISVAIPLPKEVTRDLQTAPTREYHDQYYSLNRKLNEIVLEGEHFLREAGYEAYAQTTDRVTVNEQKRSRLPHKTVATRAGLGWIGKNNLLVTREYGCAVRLSSLLTNAPLSCGEAITKSLCGGCDLCVRKCPAGALSGVLWEAGVDRDQIVDIDKCYKKQIEIMTASTGIHEDLCGKCFAVCAYTQRYLRGISNRNRIRGEESHVTSIRCGQDH